MAGRNNHWTNLRFIGWHRSRSQAHYRGETWELTMDDWKEFWPDESTWQRRGRGRDDLALTRYDPTVGWTRSNTAQVTGLEHCRIRNARRHGTDDLRHFRFATWLLQKETQ